MNFNRDTEYALLCLAEMEKEPRIYSARQLSGLCNVPYDLLCKILQRLANAEILESVQGARGGYGLARKLEEVTLSDVLDAVRRRKKMVPCLDNKACERAGGCSIQGGAVRIQSMWDEILRGVSLKDFIGMREPVIQGGLR